MVTQSVRYGENLQATMVYITNYQLIPLERAVEVIKDLTGQVISQGTLVNAGKRLEKNLKEFEASIKQQLKNADIVHFDEAGMRSEGKTKWLHSA